jgi:hypothetical protein
MQQMAPQSVSQSNATVLQSCSADLAPSDILLSRSLKQHFAGRRFLCNEEVEVAVH